MNISNKLQSFMKLSLFRFFYVNVINLLHRKEHPTGHYILYYHNKWQLVGINVS
ncbi:MAG: hypothetical protein ACLRZ7_08010 [Lachnospiraceae bacterium]